MSTGWNTNIQGRYSPRIKANGLGVYPLSGAQVTAFQQDLWTTSFFEQIANWAYGNPLDSIIALRYYYGIRTKIGRVSDDCYVTLGNQALKGGVGMGPAIITRPANSEYVEFDCGVIQIPAGTNDFRDIEPFTRLELYLPFIGMVQLNAVDFIKRYRGSSVARVQMGVKYRINIITGACVAIVTRYVEGVIESRPEESSSTVVYTAQGQVGVDIPLNIKSQTDLYSRMAVGVAGIGMAAGAAVTAPMIAAGASAAVAGGSALQYAQQSGVASSVINGVGNATAPVFNGDVGAVRMGGLETEMASMTSFTPYVKITRKVTAEDQYGGINTPVNLRDIIGKPDPAVQPISKMKGYIKVAGFFSTTTAGSPTRPQIPTEAMTEIMSILKGGAYVD